MLVIIETSTKELVDQYSGETAMNYIGIGGLYPMGLHHVTRYSDDDIDFVRPLEVELDPDPDSFNELTP